MSLPNVEIRIVESYGFEPPSSEEVEEEVRRLCRAEHARHVLRAQQVDDFPWSLPSDAVVALEYDRFAPRVPPRRAT